MRKKKTVSRAFKEKDKLHLLNGLAKILLDIDKAIKIVRETEEEAEVVPNLMIGFGIDDIQAEYVAEIKLRHLNREYILNRTSEIDELNKAIADLEDILKTPKRVKALIVDELKEVSKKFGKPRKSLITYSVEEEEVSEEEEIPDYPVNLFFTKEGYFKKITPQSLRMSGEQKLKEGDEIITQIEASNTTELLFFTDKCQVYKSRACEFDDTKASVIGDYIAAKLGMDEGENAICMIVTDNYEGNMLFFFENGKLSKVPLKSYETKTKRKKLINAYSDKSPVVAIYKAEEEGEYMLTSSSGRVLLVHSGAILAKATKDNQGVSAMTVKKGQRVTSAVPFDENKLCNPHRFRTKTLPSAGSIPKESDLGEQLTF